MENLDFRKIETCLKPSDLIKLGELEGIEEEAFLDDLITKLNSGHPKEEKTMRFRRYSEIPEEN